MAASKSPQPNRVEFDGSGFRWSNYDTPFWALPNSEPGRWHTDGEPATQYFSLSPEGAWAELIRRERLTSEPEAAQIRTPMWEAKLRLQRVADYRSFELAESAGFPPDALVDDDHSRCQQEGNRLRRIGFDGVLAPSAAMPGELCLVVFGPRRMLEWGDQPRLASAIPARCLSTGAPPSGLVERVRLVGAAHAGLLEYKRARRSNR